MLRTALILLCSGAFAFAQNPAPEQPKADTGQKAGKSGKSRKVRKHKKSTTNGASAGTRDRSNGPGGETTGLEKNQTNGAQMNPADPTNPDRMRPKTPPMVPPIQQNPPAQGRPADPTRPTTTPQK